MFQPPDRLLSSHARERACLGVWRQYLWNEVIKLGIWSSELHTCGACVSVGDERVFTEYHGIFLG